jgi:hypothetical protein
VLGRPSSATATPPLSDFLLSSQYTTLPWRFPLGEPAGDANFLTRIHSPSLNYIYPPTNLCTLIAYIAGSSIDAILLPSSLIGASLPISPHKTDGGDKHALIGKFGQPSHLSSGRKSPLPEPIMSSDRSNSPPSTPSASSRSRRASITPGASFSELLARAGNSPPQASTSPLPVPIITAAANAQVQQRRRMSITTLGLSGSPSQTSPFGNQSMRRGSVSSSVMSTSPTLEQAVLEENEKETPMTSPTTPFARRVSFGAQALRDRVGSGSGNGRYSSFGASLTTKQRPPSSTSGTSSTSSVTPLTASTHNNSSQIDKSNPSCRPLGEGFNWPEALRTRAERAPSFGTFPPSSPTAPQSHQSADPSRRLENHQRPTSISTMEQPAKEISEPTKPMSKPKSKLKPDYFQEKILRADFMD